MQNLKTNVAALLATAIVFAAVVVGVSYCTADGAQVGAEQIYSKLLAGAGIAATTLLLTRFLAVSVTSLGYSVLCAFVTTVVFGVAAIHWRADFSSIWLLLMNVGLLGGAGFIGGIAGSFASAMVPRKETKLTGNPYRRR